MDTQLVKDTVMMLQQEIEAETAITVKLDYRQLQSLVEQLQASTWGRMQQCVLLGGYMLLQQAMLAHEDLGPDHSSAVRTKHILDGDYLLGLYYRLMVKYQAFALLASLAPFQKKLQLGLLQGRTAEQAKAELLEQFLRFVSEQAPAGGDHDEAA